MARRLIAGLVVALVFGSVVGVGSAGAKKGGAKPVSFKAEGSVLVSNPNDVNFLGVTRWEFEMGCAVPPNSQGLDAYVIEVPQKVSRVESIVYGEVLNATGLDQLDFFFFDEHCTELGYVLAIQKDMPLMPRGTSFVLVRTWASDPVDFVFYAVEAR